MPTSAVILIVVVFVIMDTIIVGAVIHMATGQLREMTDAYPFRPMREPFVRREFSSMRMGITKLGGCVHLTVDRDHLHIEPAAILRWMGVRAMSVKREEIEIPATPVRSRLRRGQEVKFRNATVALPDWCVDELRKR